MTTQRGNLVARRHQLDDLVEKPEPFEVVRALRRAHRSGCHLMQFAARWNVERNPGLDNKPEYMHAFAMVREVIAWLDRTLPLSARFPKGTVFRENRLPVPADALREVILNAVMHRDYGRASSYVAIAVFDDRIEVRSVGDFPTGIRAEMLSSKHPSILRNPLIAGAFHRTGAVEVWGRGTNRVIEACRIHEIDPPDFSEQAGVVTVTFRVAVVPEAVAVPSRHQVGTKLAPSPSA